MNILSTMIIEDDPKACHELAKAIKASSVLSVVATTNNTLDALKLVKTLKPNAIILDLELNNGLGNGLDFLKEIRFLSLETSPYILITTNNSSPITYDIAHKLGADFIISKHQANYSAQTVVDFLNLVNSNIICRTIDVKNCNSKNSVPLNFEKDQIQKHIFEELTKVGIKKNSLGYQYLAEAILLIFQKSANNVSVVIANKYKKTPSSIERAMQNAIKSAWHTYDVNELYTHYTARIHPEKGFPTVMEFIYYYVEIIKNEYR